MSGASIEATLELWAAELRGAKARMRPLFTQARVAASAGQFPGGLLGPERRKTGWMRLKRRAAQGRGASRPSWGAGGGRRMPCATVVREHALAALAEPDAVLVIDETGFLKQGKASCGVGRQHTGSAGKIANCQAGVFAAYVSGKGCAFIDRALYLPRDWTRDPARMRAAHVPEGIEFAAKPQLALGMAGRAVAAGVPVSWVAADTVYGTGEVERALRRAGKGYVLGTAASQPFNSWVGKPVVHGTAEEIARALPASAWRRLSAGEGTKGARLHDWACLELADLEADEFNPALSGTWTRGLLIRRDSADGAAAGTYAYFSTWCPAGTGVEALAAAAGRRWSIEDAFETAKTELGLDRNETRSWHGWHRHVSLVMLASAMLARARLRANQVSPPKTAPRLPRPRPPSSAGRSRRSAASRRAWPSGVSGPPTSPPGRSGDAPTKPPRNAHT